MRFYSIEDPRTLIRLTRTRLLTEGYEPSEIPDVDLGTTWISGRDMSFGTGQTAHGYYRAELNLYVWDDGKNSQGIPVHSPYRRNTGQRGADFDSEIYAASFDQWGIFLGALLDIAHERDDAGVGVRFVGTYDCVGPRAVKHSDGSAFFSSREVFAAVTMREFANRGNHSVSLACAIHRWSPHPSGVSQCKKCGRRNRFAWDKGSW